MSQPVSSADIREAFFQYFESKHHTRVASASLVPHNDPTLLFNNAGMNQFKDYFLGLETRDYKRAVTSQKCVRAGGKHNDLDNVGYTARHHTFFEMLGNFSFGDYFKKDAIAFAWEFLTSPNWLNLPKEKLYVTVYANDDDAFNIWHNDIGLAPERIIRIGDNKGAAYASDNFWAMGDTGPCGPCTEIFYDHGEHIAGGLPGTPEEDGDRYMEVWNCVFMQFNRQKDGEMQPLPAPSVDTGMGLERISAIMQGVNSNYDIDIFAYLIQAAADILGIDNAEQASLKVIADHIRAVSFLIADGVNPSNEGRGYVMRRIIRRAVRHGNKLGATDSFFYKMVAPLVAQMGKAYPELAEKQAYIESTILKEEQQFAKTLAQGLKILDTALAALTQGEKLSGEAAFKLYDTYGFPVDLTADIAKERGIGIDEAGFDTCMAEQKQRARDAGKFNLDYTSLIKVNTATEFTGYEHSQDTGEIIALYVEGEQVNRIDEGTQAVIVLNNTPFYAESGGQAGEIGVISSGSGIFEVEDTQKSGQAIIHHGTVSMGNLSVNQVIEATIKTETRQASQRNHSATHLLHAALRQTLGEQVTQKGSLVNAQVLRFDFSYDQAVTTAQLQQVEKQVNSQILLNLPTNVEHMAIDAAMQKGAMALFGEKYGDTVRVLTMGQQTDNQPFSVELCGGLHVQRTGDIGLFKIISESSIAAGIRRIEAVTGLTALTYVQTGDHQLSTLAHHLKAKRHEVAERVLALADKQRELEKTCERLEQKLASSQAKDLVNQMKAVAGMPTLIATLQGVDGKTLRSLADDLKSRLDNAVIILAGVKGDKVSLIANVAKAHTGNIKAGDIIKYLAGELGGKGGGRPDSAQGGAPLADNFEQVMAGVDTWLAAQVS